jgi:WD40 repeat protein
MTGKSLSTVFRTSSDFLVGRRGRKLAIWILPFLVIEVGIQSAPAQTKDEKPFSLSHFNPDNIEVDDRCSSLPKELVAIAGTSRGRNSGWIHCIAFSPNGKQIAGAGDGKQVSIWDSATLRENALIQLDGGRVESLAFAPDGKTLAFQNQRTNLVVRFHWSGTQGTGRA